MCYIAPFPYDCVDNDDVECIRGSLAESYIWWFSFIELILFFTIIFVCQTAIFLFVRRQVTRLRRYSFDSTESGSVGKTSFGKMISNAVKPKREGARRNRTMSDQQRKVRDVAIQSGLYLLVFLTTWLCFMITRIAHIFESAAIHNNFVLFAFMIEIFFPLQGFLNFLVFMRPSYKRYRAANKEASWYRVFWAMLVGTDLTRWKREATNQQNRSSLGRFTSATLSRDFLRRRSADGSKPMDYSGDILSVDMSLDQKDAVVGSAEGEGLRKKVNDEGMHATNDNENRNGEGLQGKGEGYVTDANDEDYVEYKLRLDDTSSIGLADTSSVGQSERSHQC